MVNEHLLELEVCQRVEAQRPCTIWVEKDVVDGVKTLYVFEECDDNRKEGQRLFEDNGVVKCGEWYSDIGGLVERIWNADSDEKVLWAQAWGEEVQ